MNAPLRFTVHHPDAPFLALVKESWKPQKRRGKVVACRFMVRYGSRWHRLYSDWGDREYPHFINVGGKRIIVSGVAP